MNTEHSASATAAGAPTGLATALPTGGSARPRAAEGAPPDELPLSSRDGGLPKVLRLLGSFLLLASALTFAVQRWNSMEELGRYYVFLSFTVALATAGIFCGMRLLEDKGARTFLAIATAFVPAHFLQLGAFLYSYVHGTPPDIPSYFILRVGAFLPLAVLFVIAVPVLASVTYLGFSTLARREAKTLTVWYLVMNALLLLPVRNPEVIACIWFAAFFLLAGKEIGNFCSNTALATREGTIARTLLAVPLVCLIARNLTLYPMSWLLVSSVFTAASWALFFGIRSWSNEERVLETADVVGLATTACAWVCFACGLFADPEFPLLYAFGRAYFHDYGVLCLVLPVAALYSTLSVLKEGGLEPQAFRKLASWMAVSAAVLQLLIEEGVVSSFMCITVASFAIVRAFHLRERALLYSGCFGLAVGVLYHLKYATRLYALSPWLSLALLGAALVLGSSYLERNMKAVRERVNAFVDSLRAWS